MPLSDFLGGTRPALVRQFVDAPSCTYTYLLADRDTGAAMLIDPVREKVGYYRCLLEQLGLSLLVAADTHVHADHISGLAELAAQTGCITAISAAAGIEIAAQQLADESIIELGSLRVRVVHTPGHTTDSLCFVIPGAVFTGDTLLIRGTGRSDFQNGDARAQYLSIVERLFILPDDTLVYPGHDYAGATVSTIGEEKRFNPRLAGRSVDDYAALMANLNLLRPTLMDVAVPANRRLGSN